MDEMGTTYYSLSERSNAAEREGSGWGEARATFGFYVQY
jgi:hypothetical protein